jgi:predicted dinucleotide-utilizing enzyme
MRDPATLQAASVDAADAHVHRALEDGQRRIGMSVGLE